MELLERLPPTDFVERWLARTAAGELRVVCALAKDDPDRRERIERVTARWFGITHPRMSTVIERIMLGDQVMYIVDDDRGPSLADAAAVLADTPNDRERWVIAQIVTIADALASLAQHQPGFVHGSLAEHQLFVDPTGRARLRAPIGLVANEPPIERNTRRTGGGGIYGSPHFMSPEAALGNPLTPAADVFALASNIAYALTGAYPFEHEDDSGFGAVLVRVLTAPPAPTPTQAPGLDAILARAFAKKPADRFPTPAALGAALYECVPDAGDYDAVISDRIAAWWPSAPQAHGANPELVNLTCKKGWEQLTPTANPDVRHCSACQQQVVQVRSLAEAVPLVGQCFSYLTR